MLEKCRGKTLFSSSTAAWWAEPGLGGFHPNPTSSTESLRKAPRGLPGFLVLMESFRLENPPIPSSPSFDPSAQCQGKHSTECHVPEGIIPISMGKYSSCPSSGMAPRCRWCRQNHLGLELDHLESQDHLGWKTPPRLSSPSFDPSPPGQSNRPVPEGIIPNSVGKYSSYGMGQCRGVTRATWAGGALSVAPEEPPEPW